MKGTVSMCVCVCDGCHSWFATCVRHIDVLCHTFMFAPCISGPPSSNKNNYYCFNNDEMRSLAYLVE